MSKINSVDDLNSNLHNPTNRAVQGRRVRSLDGFIPAPAPRHTKIQPQIEDIPVATQSNITKNEIVRSRPKTVNAHQPERSKTLMRHTVKAPEKPNRVEKVQAPTDLVKQQPKILGSKPKHSSEAIDSGRADRATTVPRSRKVTRFQRQTSVTSQAAAVAPAVQLSQPVAAPSPTPVQQQAPQEQPKKDMFERAIDNAKSHEEPEAKVSTSRKAKRSVKRHARWVSITAIIFAAVILGGFIAYQNKIELQLQLADAKAGFAAAMPGFHPEGYAAKSLSYSPGKVAIGFAGPGNHSYKVVQKSSNWDSQTLLENFVATSGQPYDAYKASGRTVYVYGNGNATWVSGGVWYQVNDNGGLNKDQIIQLANSM